MVSEWTKQFTRLLEFIKLEIKPIREFCFLHYFPKPYFGFKYEGECAGLNLVLVY